MAERKKVPLYLRIYRGMRERIETGVWPAGMRLESVREQARRLGVSKFTVERVYNQLAAEGYLKAHNRARYEVRGLPLPVCAPVEQPAERPVRESFRYDFQTAAMDPRGFRFSEWRPYMYRVWRDDERLLDYGDDRGEWELRDALARYGADARDTKAGPEDIVIGSGVQQLLRLLTRLMPAEARTIHFAEEAFGIGAATFADEGYRVQSLGAAIGGGAEWWQELEQYGTQLLYVVPSYTYRAEGVLPARARTELLSYPGAQKRNAPSPSDMGRVTFMISRRGQSDIYDLTFSMGYPVRSAGYMFCYNRSMIHLASVFSGGFFGREEEDFDLTQGNFCIMVSLPLLSGVVAPIHWRYRSRYQKWTFTGQNSCQRWVRKVSGSCQKSARSGETLL